jgi:hypothetical protein
MSYQTLLPALPSRGIGPSAPGRHSNFQVKIQSWPASTTVESRTFFDSFKRFSHSFIRHKDNVHPCHKWTIWTIRADLPGRNGCESAPEFVSVGSVL